MTHPDSSTTGGGSDHDGADLRLLWPQWQGAGTSSVAAFAPEFPLDIARRGYAVGTAVPEAVLPPHEGATVRGAGALSDEGLGNRDGVEAKEVVFEHPAPTREVARGHDPAQILPVGGECSVSVPPFSLLARRYGEEMAIVWIDAHPDVGTPNSEYPGYHAMAVATLTGHGDPDVQELLPASVTPERVALVGLHSWEEDDFPNIAELRIRSFGPDELRRSTRPLLEWLAATGCSRVAVHFDVDALDSKEIVLGLGMEPDGLTSTEVRHIVADVAGAADVVGFTIAEFIPRQVMHLQQILNGFPLISGTTAG